MKKRMLKNTDAVSPVVGVMLMIVVTVVIAAVLSIYAGGMAITTQNAPSGSFNCKISNGGTWENSAFELDVISVSESTKVSPEWIIDKDPDIYIKVATHEKMDNAAGIYNDVVSRTGFSGLQSMKNGRFWLIDAGITYGPRCFAGAAAFAKMLYPDEFKDISVEDMLKDYNKRYSLNLPVENTVYPKF